MCLQLRSACVDFKFWQTGAPNLFIGGCRFDSKKDSKKNDAIKKDLTRIVDPKVQDWVVDELAQNRQKKAVKEKV